MTPRINRSFPSLVGANPALDHLHLFETSWLLPPAVLAVLRGIISLYIFLTIFAIWGWDGTHNDSSEIAHSFSYFTWLTYWGLGFYFFFSCVHTSLYALTGHSVLFDRWPRGLRALHSLFYTTVTTYPFLVTIVYWAIIYSPPWYTTSFRAWSNISQHGLNSVYALLEITLPATRPHPILSLPFLILILLLYLAVAYLTYHTEGFYTYSFLDPGTHDEKSGRVTVYCFGVLVAILVLFGVSWGLIWLRQRLVGVRIKRSARDVEFGYHGSQEGGLVEEVEMKDAVRLP